MKQTELWDTIDCTNIYIVGVPEREEKKRKKIYLKK